MSRLCFMSVSFEKRGTRVPLSSHVHYERRARVLLSSVAEAQFCLDGCFSKSGPLSVRKHGWVLGGQAPVSQPCAP